MKPVRLRDITFGDGDEAGDARFGCEQVVARRVRPAGLPGRSQSGVVISMATLCHRSWNQVARLTAHGLAGYMGLYNNVELGTERNPSWRDPIADSDGTSTNLMYFSETPGSTLSPGQRAVLTRSAVLR